MYNLLQKNSSLFFSLACSILLFSFSSCAKQDLLANVSPDLNEGGAAFNKITEMDTIITFNPDTYEETMEVVESSYYTEVETFPIYGDCSEAGDNQQAIKQCSFHNLMMAVSSNIKYPASAYEAKVEGTVNISFRLSPNGDMNNFVVEKSSQDKLEADETITEEQAAAFTALDAAALAATQALDGNWTPAMVDGKAVTIQMVLPVSFKLTE